VRALIERRLAASAVRQESAQGAFANVEGEISAELRRALESANRRAAVLLGLVEREPGLTVLFTERAAHLSHHAGQVSFPGGLLQSETESPVAAALREASEEIGLLSADVSVAGCLRSYATGTGFAVTPVVGFVAGDFVPRPEPAEVSAVFEVPLEFVLEPGNLRCGRRERFGSRFRVYELCYEGHRIWGATAAMLAGFVERISYEKTAI